MFASRLNSIQWEQLAMDCFSLVVGAMEGRKLNNNTRNFFSWLLTSRDYCFVLHVFIKCVFKYVKHTFAYVDDVLESKVFTQGCTLDLSFYQSAGVKKYIFKWTLFSFHADMFSLVVLLLQKIMLLTVFCDPQELPSVSALSKYLCTWSFFLLLLISSVCQHNNRE